MADTLAEIYNDTLVESDFNSSGEATIITTDSSTAHVIKSIQAIEVNSDLPIAGSLEVNGFDVVGLTANSSGSEIVGPSSTVKVTTDAIPFNYADDRFYVQSTGTNAVSVFDAKLNGTTVLTNEIDTTNTLPYNFTTDEDARIIAPYLGPSDNFYVNITNHNNVTTARLYNSSGTQIWSETTGYVPKWFDGSRYVYYITPGNSGIQRLDTWSTSATDTQIVSQNFDNSTSTYGRMFGIRDKWLFFWPVANSSRGYACDLTTNTVQNLTTPNADNAFSAMDQEFYAIETSAGAYKIFHTDSNLLRIWDWDGSQILDGSTQGTFTSLSLSGNSQTFYQGSVAKSVVGTKLYYVNNNRNLAYVEIDGTPAFGAELTSGSPTFSAGPYGYDLTYVETTPSASEISGRTYNASIGLKLRITGVTST
jgi:hypothetical protein